MSVWEKARKPHRERKRATSRGKEFERKIERDGGKERDEKEKRGWREEDSQTVECIRDGACQLRQLVTTQKNPSKRPKSEPKKRKEERQLIYVFT